MNLMCDNKSMSNPRGEDRVCNQWLEELACYLERKS